MNQNGRLAPVESSHRYPIIVESIWIRGFGDYESERQRSLCDNIWCSPELVCYRKEFGWACHCCGCDGWENMWLFDVSFIICYVVKLGVKSPRMAKVSAECVIRSDETNASRNLSSSQVSCWNRVDSETQRTARSFHVIALVYRDIFNQAICRWAFTGIQPNSALRTILLKSIPMPTWSGYSKPDRLTREE